MVQIEKGSYIPLAMSEEGYFSVVLIRPRNQLTILHSCSGINFKLARVNRSPQARVVSPGIFSISVSLGVIDVFGGKVATQSFFGDLELRGSVTMSQESESLSKRVSYFAAVTARVY
jgi:hypothetical protein